MGMDPTVCGKSRARVLAGQRNAKLRGPLTEAGRERLRAAANRNRPWRYSTGPRTAAGKLKAAANGRRHRPNPLSGRQLHVEVSTVTALIAQMAALRRALVEGTDQGSIGSACDLVAGMASQPMTDAL